MLFFFVLLHAKSQILASEMGAVHATGCGLHKNLGIAKTPTCMAREQHDTELQLTDAL